MTRGPRRSDERWWWAAALTLILGSWFVPLLWGSTWALRHGRGLGIGVAVATVVLYEYVGRPKDTWRPPPRGTDAPPPGRHRDRA